MNSPQNIKVQKCISFKSFFIKKSKLNNNSKASMDVIFKRFPVVRQMVLKKLDDQSLVRSIEANRVFAEILDKERLYWVRIIKKYIGKFKGVKESWKEVLHRTPVDVTKELALTVEKLFKFYILKQIIPLHVGFALNGYLNICKLITEKTWNTTYSNLFGLTPLHITANNGDLDIFKFIIGRVREKIPADIDGYTPFHLAAVQGMNH